MQLQSDIDINQKVAVKDKDLAFGYFSPPQSLKLSEDAAYKKRVDFINRHTLSFGSYLKYQSGIQSESKFIQFTH